LFLDFSLDEMAQVRNRTYYDVWRNTFTTELEQAGFSREQMRQLYDEVNNQCMRWFFQTLEQHLNLDLRDVTVGEMHVQNVNRLLYEQLQRLMTEGYITERQLDQLYTFAPLPFDAVRENYWWEPQPLYFNGHTLPQRAPVQPPRAPVQPPRARVPQARGITTPIGPIGPSRAIVPISSHGYPLSSFEQEYWLQHPVARGINTPTYWFRHQT
jgi:hypothetical protein